MQRTDHRIDDEAIAKKEPPKPKKDPKPVTIRYRSAKTGKFVTHNYGKSHPRTTIKETKHRDDKRRDSK